MQYCTLNSFTYGEKNFKKKINCGCRFIHLWTHLFTSEIILLPYIKFYCTTSHLATQKREILEHLIIKGFNVVLAIFQTSERSSEVMIVIYLTDCYIFLKGSIIAVDIVDSNLNSHKVSKLWITSLNRHIHNC